VPIAGGVRLFHLLDTQPSLPLVEVERLRDRGGLHPLLEDQWAHLS
jgi:hypothetical protein